MTHSSEQSEKTAAGLLTVVEGRKMFRLPLGRRRRISLHGETSQQNNFANSPPLNGGGIFQFGFQYGGRREVSLQPKMACSAGYRETLNPQPNFIGRSIHIDDYYDSDAYIVFEESSEPMDLSIS